MFTQTGFDNLAYSRQQALQLFRNSEFWGRWHKWLSRITRCPASLPSLEAAGESQGVIDRHYAGIQVVPLENICGSEGRPSDFDNNFRPTDERTMQRWINVAQARLEGKVLPPVELIQVGDDYFVRDGHHRISVAHALGEAYIDAEVTVWRPQQFQ